MKHGQILKKKKVIINTFSRPFNDFSKTVKSFARCLEVYKQLSCSLYDLRLKQRLFLLNTFYKIYTISRHLVTSLAKNIFSSVMNKFARFLDDLHGWEYFPELSSLGLQKVVSVFVHRSCL